MNQFDGSGKISGKNASAPSQLGFGMRLKIGSLSAVALGLGWIFTLIGPSCVDCSPTGNCLENFRELGFQFRELFGAILPSSVALGVACGLMASSSRRPIIARHSILFATMAVWPFVTATLTPFYAGSIDVPGILVAAIGAFFYVLVQMAQYLIFLSLIRGQISAKTSSTNSKFNYTDVANRLCSGLRMWIVGMALVQVCVGTWLYLRSGESCQSMGLAQLPETSIYGVSIDRWLLAFCAAVLLLSAARHFIQLRGRSIDL